MESYVRTEPLDSLKAAGSSSDTTLVYYGTGGNGGGGSSAVGSFKPTSSVLSLGLSIPHPTTHVVSFSY